MGEAIKFMTATNMSNMFINTAGGGVYFYDSYLIVYYVYSLIIILQRAHISRHFFLSSRNRTLTLNSNSIF